MICFPLSRWTVSTGWAIQPWGAPLGFSALLKFCAGQILDEEVRQVPLETDGNAPTQCARFVRKDFEAAGDDDVDEIGLACLLVLCQCNF